MENIYQMLLFLFIDLVGMNSEIAGNFESLEAIMPIHS
jgi:hypothetical protein